MRIDPKHKAKIDASIAIDADGNRIANLDIEFMQDAMNRCTLWERGLLVNAILRAANALTPTQDQRALLALFLVAEQDPAPSPASSNGQPAHEAAHD